MKGGKKFSLSNSKEKARERGKGEGVNKITWIVKVETRLEANIGLKQRP